MTDRDVRPLSEPTEDREAQIDAIYRALPGETEDAWSQFWHRVDDPDGWSVSIYGIKLAAHLYDAGLRALPARPPEGPMDIRARWDRTAYRRPVTPGELRAERARLIAAGVDPSELLALDPLAEPLMPAHPAPVPPGLDEGVLARAITNVMVSPNLPVGADASEDAALIAREYAALREGREPG